MLNDFTNYTFPSNKKLGKFPSVTINGNANDFIIWLEDHPEIDRRVPPIYPDFVVNYKAEPEEWVKYLSNLDVVIKNSWHKPNVMDTLKNTDHYSLFVHYNPDVTAFCYRLKLNEITLFTAVVDYDLINGDSIYSDGNFTKKSLDLYAEEWLKKCMLASAYVIVAVQAYMLYFKPEIVEQIYTPSESTNKSPEKPGKRVTAEPIKIRKSKIKRITLDANDRPPKDINYRKLSWHVRGHYRHVGKNKKLKYIQPFTCNRGGKKYRRNAPKYIIGEDKENTNA